MTDVKIKQICTTISRYYNTLGIEYDALFSTFCEDNGIDDDAVEEELQETDCEDSILVDFDENFPFAASSEPKNKPLFIMNIIKTCYNHPHHTFCYILPIFDKAFFEIKEDDYTKTIKIYTKQCPCLYSYASPGSGIQYITAVGLKNKFEYLWILIDCYYRAKIKTIDKCVHVGQWAATNKHLQALKYVKFNHQKQANMYEIALNHQKQIYIPAFANMYEIASNAISAMCHRTHPPLILSASTQKINDSIEITIKYIDASIKFIDELITNAKNNDEILYPFQMDFCIGFGAPVVGSNFDVIGDIQKKLDKNNLTYESKRKYNPYLNKHKQLQFIHAYFKSCFGNIKNEILPDGIANIIKSYYGNMKLLRLSWKTFDNLFQQFKKHNPLKTYDTKNNNQECFHYFHRKRFIIFIDHRNQNGDNTDDIFMYYPPKNCVDIPKDAVPEWFMDASQICILPNDAYGDGNAAENWRSTRITGDHSYKDMSGKLKFMKEEDIYKRSNIGSHDDCKAQLLTFSFITKDTNAIKCYLYWNGRICRFMPSDIKDVLPRLFNMEWNNEISVSDYSERGANELFMENNEVINKLITKIENVLNDECFQNFLEEKQSYRI
eukprot:543082_1